MIPAWKLKREINRIGAQILGIPRWIVNLPMRLGEPRRRKDYDARRHELIRITPGTAPETGRIAIFLIFQPGGIKSSTLFTCRWLIAGGYSPFIISNCPLDDSARDALKGVAWRILERPNFGYDFGGYRDGILLLSEWNIAPDRLVVMNDSVWIPMVGDLMQKVEAMTADADIVGLLQDEKVAHDRQGGRPTDRRHIESYFYLFTPAALTHPAFMEFWKTYRMTDFKPHTIKFGELGFSRRMAQEGLRLRALSTRSAFMERLARQDDAFLAETLRYAAYEDRDIARDATAVAQRRPDEPGWREAVLDHVRRSANRKRFNSAFPYANDGLFGTMFMKKSREPIFTAMRARYLEAVAAGKVAMPPAEILSEIEELVARQKT